MAPALHAASPTVERGPVAPVLLTGLALAGLSGTAAMVTGDAAVEAVASRLALPPALSVALSMWAPVVALAVGLWGPAKARAGLLLFGVPAALAVGGLVRPSAPLDPIVFCVCLATLLGYLVAALRYLEAAPTAGARIEPRSGEELAPRLRRRLRMYRVFRGCAVLGFAAPLAAAVYAIAGEGGAHPLLLVATAGLLGALAARAFLVDALERHLQRDAGLVAALTRLRRHARRGRPSTAFYVAAGVALVTMLAFALRTRSGLAVDLGGLGGGSP